MSGPLLQTIVDSLAEYPAWFVIACMSIVAAALLYALAKAVKWLLYFLIFLVLAGGLGGAVWLIMRGGLA